MRIMDKLALGGGTPVVPKGLIKPWPIITPQDEAAVLDALRSGKLWEAGTPNALKLQEEWASYTGVKNCILTQSGTAALHMAVAAAGVGPGDEVLVPAFSFVASATCVLHQNAIPIFVDIDRTNGNIAVNEIEDRISKRTKAIIVVHIHGLPADMDKICEIARRWGIVVIEDACQAHGAEYRGKKAGSLGDIACFSLNGCKNLSAGGEGGLLVTNNDDYAEVALATGMYGMRKDGMPHGLRNLSRVSWMYRGQELPAALARSQLERLDEYNDIRRQNCKYLTENLGRLNGAEPIFEPTHKKHAYFAYSLRCDPFRAGYDYTPNVFREGIEKALHAEGVMIGQSETQPIPNQELFRQRVGYGRGCPWSCNHYHKNSDYQLEHFPNALKWCEEYTLIWGHFPPNDLSLMRRYVEAFEKVFNNIEEVMRLASTIPEVPAYSCELMGAAP